MRKLGTISRKFAVLLLCLLPALSAAESIRVRMTRLETENALTFRVRGNYVSADGKLLLPDGTEAAAFLAEGRILLHAGGIAVDCGERLSLFRAEGESEALLTFGTNGNAFAGDLLLAISGGKIVPVLMLDVETYVAGVVPYEMGDSFPTEALKAQAVAARTYALARKGAYDDYDVVDNTNDQVYRGVPSDSPQSAQAVRETEGVVALYRGAPAICYYTASNGGQTERGEVAWPERKNRDYGYMEQKDDPYDLVNERSPVRRCTLPKTFESGKEDPAARVLVESMGEALKAAGLPSDADLVRLDALTKVSVAFPENDKVTRVPAGLSMRAKVSARRRVELTVPAETSGVQGTASVVGTAYTEYVAYDKEIEWNSPFFGVLERGLGLSINQTDNEILTILETESAFVLETRRYGHGVGMSQRGAEEMANRKMKMEDIFSFYYPGLTLTKTEGTATPPPTIPPALAATPKPTASPTPRPTLMPLSTLPEGARVAWVTGIAEDSSLNLRAGPALSSEILRRLYLNQPLAVMETDAAGWAHVSTDVSEGYVRSEYLTFEKPE
ncbi:MAG: SpoIID/LytB domain-containing protein [Clostridiales bacterium]|nr:SpoIID/LytB domain-containing protein [Clostridiales bacterium]